MPATVPPYDPSKAFSVSERPPGESAAWEVIAKFRVDAIEPPPDQPRSADTCPTIIARPVYDPDPESENGRFWRATPAGELRLGTVNPAAYEKFAVGQEIYLRISPAR